MAGKYIGPMSVHSSGDPAKIQLLVSRARVSASMIIDRMNMPPFNGVGGQYYTGFIAGIGSYKVKVLRNLPSLPPLVFCECEAPYYPSPPPSYPAGKIIVPWDYSIWYLMLEICPFDSYSSGPYLGDSHNATADLKISTNFNSPEFPVNGALWEVASVYGADKKDLLGSTLITTPEYIPDEAYLRAVTAPLSYAADRYYAKPYRSVVDWNFPGKPLVTWYGSHRYNWGNRVRFGDIIVHGAPGDSAFLRDGLPGFQTQTSGTPEPLQLGPYVFCEGVRYIVGGYGFANPNTAYCPLVRGAAIIEFEGSQHLIVIYSYSTEIASVFSNTNVIELRAALYRLGNPRRVAYNTVSVFVKPLYRGRMRNDEDEGYLFTGSHALFNASGTEFVCNIGGYWVFGTVGVYRSTAWWALGEIGISIRATVDMLDYPVHSANGYLAEEITGVGDGSARTYKFLIYDYSIHGRVKAVFSASYSWDSFTSIAEHTQYVFANGTESRSSILLGLRVIGDTFDDVIFSFPYAMIRDYLIRREDDGSGLYPEMTEYIYEVSEVNFVLIMLGMDLRNGYFCTEMKVVRHNESRTPVDQNSAVASGTYDRTNAIDMYLNNSHLSLLYTKDVSVPVLPGPYSL